MSKYIDLNEATDLFKGIDATMTGGWVADTLEALPTIEVSEDAISREDAIRWVKTECNPYGKPTLDYDSGRKVIEHLKKMPTIHVESVMPKPKEGKRSRCIWCDSPYRIEYNWIDREGNTASFADEDRHLVATGIANYCPNCGMKMKGDKE